MFSPALYTTTHLLAFILLLITSAGASSHKGPEKLVDNGGYMIQGEDSVLQFRAHEPFVPASTLKILTSLFALETLGKEFRFETHFFLDKGNNLYIKGYGDPFLTSESLLQIAKELSQKGVRRITSLFLDDSSFQLDSQVADTPSANPYDAPNGALAVNFNALPIHIGGDGTISSGEPQTPLLPMMNQFGQGRLPGSYRLNVNMYHTTRQLAAPLHYAGELFISLFDQAGIVIERGFSGKHVPEEWTPIYIHYGPHPLEEIVRACLKYSNNFIANQLFLAVGVSYFGLPATWEKSRRAMNIFTRKILGGTRHQLRVVEGSGLSRDNRVSAATLVEILSHFSPYGDLLPVEHNFLLKTGTLEDVFCYAGYIPENGGLVPIAILLNQERNSRGQLVKLLSHTWLQRMQDQ